MKVIIRKIGNANGIIIPASIQKKHGLKTGDKVDIDEINGQIVVTKTKPKYTLDELLAKCDPSAPLIEEMKEWDQMKPAGLECAFSAAGRSE